MTRILSPRRRAFLLAALAGTAGVAVPAGADDPAPGAAAAPPPVAAVVAEPSPFAGLVERVRVGEPTLVGTQTLVPLWAPKEARPSGPAGPRAWVGLAGTGAVVLDLPAPVGLAIVHVSNPLASPLYLPRGEVLVPPAGFPWAVDRPVWIAPGTSAFVPVVQTVEPPGGGPYEASLDRLSPASLRALRAGDWANFVTLQNQALNWPRVLDPLGGYASGVFAAESGGPLASIEGARAGAAGAVVGVAIGDAAGLVTLVLEADAARMRAQWPALARGIALDEVARRHLGVPMLPRQAGVRLVAEAVSALRELAALPTLRPAFGEGDQARWPAGDATARWIGLVVDGLPITATFHRSGGPGPIPGVQPPVPRPNPPPEPPPVPGEAELDRKAHLTPFEGRVQDRRDGRDDGSGGVGGGGGAGHGGGGGAGPGMGIGD